MKPLVCIYCEGNELKLSVVAREKENIRVFNTFTVKQTEHEADSNPEQLADLSKEDFSADGLSFESLDTGVDTTQPRENVNATDVELIAASLAEYNLNQAQFIPIVTDPSVNFHIYESSEEKNKSKLLENVVKDIFETKGITVAKDKVDCINLDNNTYLCVFVDKEILMC